MTDTETAPIPSLNNSKMVQVALNEPVVRGEITIDKVTLRKPRAGEMRGLNLDGLLTGDVAATISLLTRISDPVLTGDEVENLDADDFAELGGTIRGFFMSPVQKEALANHFRQMAGASPSSS